MAAKERKEARENRSAVKDEKENSQVNDAAASINGAWL
jgi:hypothetical protein